MALRVSLAFAGLPDQELDNFADGVHDGMSGNAAYPTPPATATMPILATARGDFEAKMTAAAQGGPGATAAKNGSRQELIKILRKLANYVEGACNDDLPTLLSSGFQAASTERRRLPLDRPSTPNLDQGDMSGQLVASVDPVRNCKMYEGRAKGPTGDWLPSVFTGDSQHVIFSGLTPGTVYTIQIRALGGSTGASDWSDPSSHMVI